MTNSEKLKRIAEIIESVDHRCMAADGSVTATLEEMRQDEISEIYELASRRAYKADAKWNGLGIPPHMRMLEDD